MSALEKLIEIVRRAGRPKKWRDKEAREAGLALRKTLYVARAQQDDEAGQAMVIAALWCAALRLAFSLPDADLRGCVPVDAAPALFLVTRGPAAAAEEVAAVLRGAHRNELAPKDAACLCVALATTLVDLTGALDLVLAPLNSNPPDPKAN